MRTYCRRTKASPILCPLCLLFCHHCKVPFVPQPASLKRRISSNYVTRYCRVSPGMIDTWKMSDDVVWRYFLSHHRYRLTRWRQYIDNAGLANWIGI